MTDKGSSPRAGRAPVEHGLDARNPAPAARPLLLINPPQDGAFTAAAEALLDDGVRSLTSFQEALRGRFREAVVHARDLSGEADAVWYVFRDGRWVNGHDGHQRVIDG